MGEKTNVIGDYGENFVNYFLNEIGWVNLTHKKDIKCSLKHLTSKGKQRETHGIDFIFSYLSNLKNDTLNNIIVSSKFSNKKYPNNPNSRFKVFYNELIETIECYRYSETRKNNIKNFPIVNNIEDIGVIFWLNKEMTNNNITTKISNPRIEQEDSKLKIIYLVDNKNVLFILSSLSYLKRDYSNYNWEFYYPLTGLNVNPLNRQNTGKTLPVEYLNSSLLPFKLTDKDNPKDVIFCLFTNDKFEENDCKRLIGLTKDITTNLPGKIIILFPDYNPINQKEMFSDSLNAFNYDSEFIKNVSINNYIELI